MVAASASICVRAVRHAKVCGGLIDFPVVGVEHELARLGVVAELKAVGVKR